jgi:hypothetical protein
MRPRDQSNPAIATRVADPSTTGIMLQRNTQMLCCNANVKVRAGLSPIRHFFLDTGIAET